MAQGKVSLIASTVVFMVLVFANFMPSDLIPRFDTTFNYNVPDNNPMPGLCAGVDLPLYQTDAMWSQCSMSPWPAKGFPLRLNSPDDNSVILPLAALDVAIDAAASMLIVIAWKRAVSFASARRAKQ